jgi:hypothetical protein
MNSLRSVDLSLIDEILRGGEKGYVLDFSNRTFSDFFVRELDIDIDAPEYATDGISKAKRLRCFLGKVALFGKRMESGSWAGGPAPAIFFRASTSPTSTPSVEVSTMEAVTLALRLT